MIGWVYKGLRGGVRRMWEARLELRGLPLPEAGPDPGLDQMGR